jgi:N-acetylmuramoyl-L-alanine amidase
VQKSTIPILLLLTLLLLLLLQACGDAAGATPNPNSVTVPGMQVNSNPASPVHLIALDPGHGADDPGTSHITNGKMDLLEKDVTLQIALKTSDILHADGYKVVLTRSQDKSPNDPPRDLNGDGQIDLYDDLQARVNIANNAKADLFLSIHVNSSDLGNDVGGFETWYCADRPFSAKSKHFAELVQQYSVQNLKALGYDAQNRRVDDDINLDSSGDHIFVLGPPDKLHTNATQMPGALTEALFISNDTEANLLRDSKTITALANAYAKAVEDYFK